MKLHVSLPFDRVDDGDEFLSMAAVREIGETLERSGFDGGNVTDHPVPSANWLAAGGHHAQDPFVMLSLLAASTERLRLQTGILVLPYRNPFIVARAAATLDVFSGGRLRLGLGAGYLKGEYYALGADFDHRNDTMDEYIGAMKAAWRGEPFSFEGTGYSARGCQMQPVPAQKPHPPLLVGGNSRRAIRRAVELGDGWYPFFTPAALSGTAKTGSISNEAELAQALDYLREHCDKVGRQSLPEIFLGSITRPGDVWQPQVIVDKLLRLNALGVAGAVLHIDGNDRQQWCDHVRRAGEEVITPLRAQLEVRNV